MMTKVTLCSKVSYRERMSEKTFVLNDGEYLESWWLHVNHLSADGTLIKRYNGYEIRLVQTA